MDLRARAVKSGKAPGEFTLAFDSEADRKRFMEAAMTPGTHNLVFDITIDANPVPPSTGDGRA